MSQPESPIDHFAGAETEHGTEPEPEPEPGAETEPETGAGAGTAPERIAVPVPGGELSVLRWPATVPGAPTVVAVHGITANGLAWFEVARRLAGRAT
ncbi:hypothetical protein ACFU6L_29470, partial [Kitasatospora sp. NPDC057541]